MPSKTFVQAVQENQFDVVGSSAMLTTTSAMETVIKSLQATCLRDKVKVVVGGAPLTESFAHQIGADGFAPDANRVVVLALFISWTLSIWRLMKNRVS